MRTLSPETCGAQRPQNNITPGGIEADGDQFLVPLDAVDGQLSGGGGNSDHGGIVDQAEHKRGKGEADPGDDPFSGNQKDPDGTEWMAHGDTLL